MESIKKFWNRIVGKQPRGKVTISAVIKRADGTVEDLGVLTEGYLDDWKVSKIRGG
jgi:hypothetical protein